MAAPIITVNSLTPGTVQPGGTAEWRTVAHDPDARTAALERPVTDTQGNVTVARSELVMSDPLTYGLPTCDDPAVTLVVDPNDPYLVHVSVAP